MDLNTVNILVFAYIGDSIYELMIRNYLINKGINKVNKLQTMAKNYVTAKSQATFITKLLDENLLIDEEMDIVKRGRNAKVYSHPKNTDILTYKHATSLECLFGYLYLKQDMNRINELIRIITEE